MLMLGLKAILTGGSLLNFVATVLLRKYISLQHKLDRSCLPTLGTIGVAPMYSTDWNWNLNVYLGYMQFVGTMVME